jgi:phage terminase small subunit
MNQQINKFKVKAEVQKVNDVINEFTSLLSIDENTFEKIANDESESLVKRKLVSYIKDHDPKVSLDAIKFIYGMYQANSLHLDIPITSDEFYLTDGQKKILEETKKSLPNPKEITKGDLDLLRLYAINLDRYNKTSMFIEQFGIKAKMGTGHEQVRPEVTIMNQAAAMIQKLSDKLLLNTESQIKLKVEFNTDSKDPLSDFE